MAKLSEARGQVNPAYQTFNQCKEAKAMEEALAAMSELGSLKEARDKAVAARDEFEAETQKAYKAATVELPDSVTPGSLFESVLQDIEKEKLAFAQENPDPIQEIIRKRELATLGKMAEFTKEAWSILEGVPSLFETMKDEGKPSLSATSNKPENLRQRGFLLTELSHTDDILSKFPKEDVAKAYEQIVRIAPELAAEKEPVRALLRQTVNSQALGPFEAEQLIKADHELLKKRRLAKGLTSGPSKD